MDGPRPLVTLRRGVSERVELSVASTANWVAKLGNLLVLELGLAPGDRVALDLPAHWSAPAWALACLTRGLVVTNADAAPDVLVVGADDVASLRAALDGRALPPTVAAVATRDLLGRWDAALPWDLPTELVDALAAARSQPDDAVGHLAPTPTAPAVELAGTSLDQRGLLQVGEARVDAVGLEQRLVVSAPVGSLAGLLDGAVVPVLGSGGVVLVRDVPPAVLADMARTERATLTPSG
jgi:uncharacterized protein (TIGR03089 family)